MSTTKPSQRILRESQQIEDTIENDQNREQWKEHSLYKEHTKQELESMCKKLKVPITRYI